MKCLYKKSSCLSFHLHVVRKILSRLESEDIFKALFARVVPLIFVLVGSLTEIKVETCGLCKTIPHLCNNCKVSVADL